MPMGKRGRPSAIEEQGLDLVCAEQEDGTWLATLKDDTGEVLFEKDGYLNEKSAYGATVRWVRLYYEDPRSTRIRRAPEPPRTSSSHRQLVQMIRTKAATNAKEVVRLREQADLLETEAKRLEDAANVLEGPEG